MHSKTDILIIGAGLAGLSCGMLCAKKRPTLIVEKAPIPGGLCVTNHQGKYAFDCCAHLLHFKTDKVKNFIEKDLNIALNEFSKQAFVQIGNSRVKHPIQCHLHGLSPSQVKDCLLGIINARYNPLYPLYYSANSFHDWIYKSFGSGIARLFMLPYNKKFWRYPLEKMGTDWVESFIAVPSLEQVLEGALRDVSKNYGYNSTFWYPKDDTIGTLAAKMASKTAENIVYNKTLVQLDLTAKKAIFGDGTAITYKTLITSADLKQMGTIVKNPPANALQDFEALKCRGIINVNFGLKENPDLTTHWTYYADDFPVFFRKGYPHTFAPASVPGGAASAYTETTFLPGQSTHQLEKQIKADFEKLNPGLEIVETNTNKIDCAYVVYTQQTRDVVSRLEKYLAANDVFLCGRYGKWSYMSMEDTIMDGWQTADKILHHTGSHCQAN